MSALSVFFRDFAQLTGIVTGILFWLTPILWGPAQMGERALAILKLNPMYYVASGWRDSLIDGVPFWQRPAMTAWFWTAALAALVAGRLVFRRLKPHFADLL